MTDVTAAPSEAGEDQLRLPRPPGALRSLLGPNQIVTEVVIVVFALLVGWAQVDRTGLVGALWDVLGGPWSVVNVLCAVSLLLRRTHSWIPLAVALVTNLLVLVDPRGPLIVPLAVAIYSAAVYRSNRAAVVGAAIAIAVVGATEAGLGVASGRSWFLAIICMLLALVVGAIIGDRRRYLAAVVARAEQLATDRDQRARLAVAAERARIARELHDVVAHGLSVVVRLSDGADAVADSDPGRSREAIQQIGVVGRESLRDMRRLLGVLSDAELEPDLAPQPSLADLDALVATYRTAGLPVDMERSGTASLDGAAQLVVYRVVQEGLTNVLRYARTPSRVLVRLRLAEEVEVEVVDDGLGSGQQPSVGLGRGLIGLRERAAMYGAEVEAGPRAEIGGHGWRLRFRFAPQAARTGGRDE